MRKIYILIALLLLALIPPEPGFANDEEDTGPTVQFHGFISQGYMFTGNNFYLTVDAGDGSVEWQDVSLSITSQVTDKLRVGLQLYSRDLGDLSNHTLELDWAYVDYHWHDSLGIRLGKIKTPFGLYNDQQDLEFLHTWILLPQSIYPTSLRSLNLSHSGVDLYGTIEAGELGDISYQMFYGIREIDEKDGFFKGFRKNNMVIEDYDVKWFSGINTNWQTPLEGLSITTGLIADKYSIEGVRIGMPQTPGMGFGSNKYSGGMGGGGHGGGGMGGGGMGGGGHGSGHEMPQREPRQFQWDTDNVRLIYRAGAEWFIDRWHLAAEYQRSIEQFEDFEFGLLPEIDRRGWYVSASYQLFDMIQVGSYFSHLLPNVNLDTSKSENYQKDWAFTVRWDLNRSWVFKAEIHDIEGWGLGIFEGPQVETDTLDESWRMLALKLSFNF